MSDDYSKFTSPRSDEELYQGLETPVTFSVNPADGMPTPVIPDHGDKPPPLSVDTLICMEDKRSFVIRNSDGSIWQSFEPKEVKRLPNGEWFVEAPLFLDKVNAGGAKPYTSTELACNHDLSLFIRRHGEFEQIVRVEPIRPACRHYLRMQTDTSLDRSKRYLSRACMAQHSDTGEYISVGDAGIFACNIRSPRHLESEALLDYFDDLKIQQGLEREKAGAFDVEAELAAEKKDGGLGVLG